IQSRCDGHQLPAAGGPAVFLFLFAGQGPGGQDLGFGAGEVDTVNDALGGNEIEGVAQMDGPFHQLLLLRVEELGGGAITDLAVVIQGGDLQITTAAQGCETPVTNRVSENAAVDVDL